MVVPGFPWVLRTHKISAAARRALPPLELDDGGAGGRAVKVAGSLPLAALGDSPPVRRDAPPRTSWKGAADTWQTGRAVVTEAPPPMCASRSARRWPIRPRPRTLRSKSMHPTGVTTRRSQSTSHHEPRGSAPGACSPMDACFRADGRRNRMQEFRGAARPTRPRRSAWGCRLPFSDARASASQAPKSGAAIADVSGDRLVALRAFRRLQTVRTAKG